MKFLSQLSKIHYNYICKFLGIKTTNVFLPSSLNTRKDGSATRGIRLRIKRTDSLIRFKNEVGFENDIKEDKLNRIIMLKTPRRGQ